MRKNSLPPSCWNMGLSGRRKAHMKSIYLFWTLRKRSGQRKSQNWSNLFLTEKSDYQIFRFSIEKQCRKQSRYGRRAKQSGRKCRNFRKQVICWRSRRQRWQRTRKSCCLIMWNWRSNRRNCNKILRKWFSLRRSWNGTYTLMTRTRSGSCLNRRRWCLQRLIRIKKLFRLWRNWKKR